MASGREEESNRVLPVIFRVLGALRPAVATAPFKMTGRHIAAVADAKQQRATRPVVVFMDLAGRMDDENARLHEDAFAWRAHNAAALEAKIDFGGVRMAVIRADLPGLPAGDRDVALFYAAQDFFDVLFRIVFGLFDDAENLHGGAPAARSRPRLFRGY